MSNIKKIASVLEDFGFPDFVINEDDGYIRLPDDCFPGLADFIRQETGIDVEIESDGLWVDIYV